MLMLTMSLTLMLCFIACGAVMHAVHWQTAGTVSMAVLCCAVLWFAGYCAVLNAVHWPNSRDNINLRCTRSILAEALEAVLLQQS